MSGRKYGGQWYEHDLLGWNYKITEFQAALAYCQLNKPYKKLVIKDMLQLKHFIIIPQRKWFNLKK